MGAKMSKPKIITFKSDTKERKGLFEAASFAHPAKMVLGLQIYLIEHYTKPGDTILDPMAGSGTLLMACTLGRNVVLVELEDKFVKMQQDNWQKIKSLGPMLGFTMGKAVILKGDARNLEGLLADNILFSPPYAEALDRDEHKHPGGRVAEMLSRSYLKSSHGRSKGQIGNLPYGKADAILTSPPYEDNTAKINGSEKFWKERERKWGSRVASPRRKEIDSQDYGKNFSNIGNLKNENYLEAMFSVYENCHKVLKDKGIMVLVTKNFIRDKKVIRLDLDTIKLCEKAGFKLIDILKRRLTSMSFWRIIYKQRYPDAPTIDFEDILIFERK